MRRSTLIQIHYHDRPGGVTTVMAEYVRTFRRVVGDNAESVVVCSHDGNSGECPGSRLILIRDCNYRMFRSVCSFAMVRDRLVRALQHVVDTEAQRGSVCVIAHNLSLGRNVALAAAFAELARRWSPRSVRFFSVVHDRADDGRPVLWQQLRRLARRGVPVGAALYPRRHITFVTPSRTTYRQLVRRGLPVRYLLNPLPPVSSLHPRPQDYREFYRTLGALAREDGITLPTESRLALYPSRVIARKNPLEAVIVACMILHYTLLFGAPGTSPTDRRLCSVLRDTCRRLGLPVVIDSARLFRQLGLSKLCGGQFGALYHFSHLCISTAVREGFGYALYEPWAYGRAVIGRRPEEFESAGGVDHSHLYDRMLVPGDMVSKRTRSVSDFAVLDTFEQVRVIERLVREPELIGRIQFARGGRTINAEQFEQEVTAGSLQFLIARNRRAVMRSMGRQTFCRAFRHCFLGE